jgi:hypothetical protein
MLNYFGKEYDFKSLSERVGHISQIAGSKRYVFTEGRSKGVEAVDIKTGTGLNFTVLLDRALDIAWAEYKGIPLAYLASPGIVSPQYYDQDSNEWLRSFTGGLMTTCGLSNAGEAAEWNGIKYGQHGRISNLPGENIHIDEAFDGEDYSISVSGRVSEVKAFYEHLVLQRTIKAFAGGNSIFIRDVVENKTTGRHPFMLLYHFNFGFPLINKDSEILISGLHEADSGMREFLDLSNPVKPGQHRQTSQNNSLICHPVADKNNQVYFLISNDRQHPELALLVTYRYGTLKNLMIWKHLYAGNEVLCIEPANCHLKGIAEEAKKGTLEYLEPFEKREINIEIKVLETAEEITSTRKFLQELP